MSRSNKNAVITGRNFSNLYITINMPLYFPSQIELRSYNTMLFQRIKTSSTH